MNIDHLSIADVDTGTFFPASSAYLLDLRKLSDQELDDFNDGTDSDRNALTERYGVSLQQILNDL